ncbi:HAD-IIB family hydrolase [Mycoplasmopsis glycophila]|nr:HAD family hydrolase [Mycoplasmopsis glycophila]
MKKPKIIFIDLDGTAMDASAEHRFQKRPSEYTKRVIKKLSTQIPVVVSTGRGVNETTKEIVHSLGSDTYIAWNGAQIVIDGEVEQKEIIPNDVVAQVFKELRKNNCFVIFNSNIKEQTYVRNKFYKMLMHVGKATAHTYKEFQNDFPVYKALVWCLSKNKLHKVAQKLRIKFQDKIEVSLSGSRNNIIEITKKDVSKGDAEVWFCNRFEIDPMNAIHIGDSLNDASTKGKIGKLVAMKNSVDAVLSIADEVTEYDCNNQGLAKYLEKFIEE